MGGGIWPAFRPSGEGNFPKIQMPRGFPGGCLRHDLSTHVEISATCNMKLRLAIKFPTPYEWWSNALPPAQEKASNARGMEGDVEASIWLDWYIMSYMYSL